MGFEPRSFSRLRPSSNYTQVQIPLRFLPVLVSTLVSDYHASESEESLHRHLDKRELNTVVVQTWDERSVPRLTCVLRPTSDHTDLLL